MFGKKLGAIFILFAAFLLLPCTNPTITRATESDEFNLVSPTSSNPTYSFSGVNISFNRDIIVPTDWSGIKLLDENGNALPIQKVRTTVSPRELQVASSSIADGHSYTLMIDPHTISDTQGNWYEQPIQVNFSCSIPFTFHSIPTYSFPGIDLVFSRDLVVPADWSGIKILDSNNNEIPIDQVNTTISPKELQICSSAITDGQSYTLFIDPHTISDTQGNWYEQPIQVAFTCSIPFTINSPTNANPVYSFQGINVSFNRNIVIPSDWSGIRILDENGNPITINQVRTTMYPYQLQVYSSAITDGHSYTLLIDPHTISDTQGNWYEQPIQINFSYSIPFTVTTPPNLTYSFPGVNISFSRDIIVPTDWSGIKILDENGNALPIQKVRTTISPRELQVASSSITDGHSYTLIINPHTISDTQGNWYEQPIQASFSCSIPFTFYSIPTYTFSGINLVFTKDLVVPADWSGIKILDSNNNQIPIERVNTTISSKELQIYSSAISDGQSYTLFIDPYTISDTQGNWYEQPIQVSFSCSVPFTFHSVPTYSFPGINLVFTKDLVVPADWSGIKVLDSNNNQIPIERVNTTISPKELQIYSSAITDGRSYTLFIDPHTISDTQGNWYEQPIQISFSCSIPFSIKSPTNANPVYSFQGINVSFTRNIVIPSDWSGIRILDEDGNSVAIDQVHTTRYPYELQIYSSAITDGHSYTLLIDPHTISDTQGNWYEQPIQINFSCSIPFTVQSPTYANPVYYYQGISVSFTRDIIVPSDGSKIRILDAENNQISIDQIQGSPSPREVVIFSNSIISGQPYTLIIDPHTISDTQGNWYEKSVQINFTCSF